MVKPRLGGSDSQADELLYGLWFGLLDLFNVSKFCEFNILVFISLQSF